jgi:5-oxoprolinase (ATP-hydrolysing) subunit A
VQLDLNCDLGEGEPPARTWALMRRVTSVNVACGVHAGDAATMERCVRLAKTSGVRLGAHPGLAGAFGRGEVRLTPGELRQLVVDQVGALRGLAEKHGVRLRHVKLHGALYHAVEREPGLARGYLATMDGCFPGLAIYALAGGRVATLGRRQGLPVWEEAFLDRGYRDDGSLVPRAEEGALLTTPGQVRERLRSLIGRGGWATVSGGWLTLAPRTLCVHGDTPGALRLLGAIRREITMRP